MSYIICFGNPLDGFEYIGTFYDVESANCYANRHLQEFDWWIILLQEPAENS